MFLPANLIRPVNLVIILVFCLGCGQSTGSGIRAKDKIKLTLEVIPEDYDKNLYSVQWTDTLGQSKGYSIINRPEELQCIITNKAQDTLGYYIGLSTPQTFAAFQTTDTVITINFKICINIFSEDFNTKDNIRREYLGKDSIPKELEPVTLNIKDNLRKKMTIELIEK